MAPTRFLIAPSSDALDATERELGLSPALLRHALDRDELPRLERDGDATLVILRVPLRNPDTTGLPYITLPVGLVVGPWGALVASRMECGVTDHLRTEAASPDVRPSHLLLRLILNTAQSYLLLLGDLRRALDALEERVTRAMGNQEVLALLRHQKSLVFFTTALRLNELLLERLRKDPLMAVGTEDSDMLEDALVEMHQAMEVTRINSDILANTMDAFASIISNNLNAVMKLLTALTILMSIPMLVASLYGMNVPVPGHEQPWAFAAITVGSLALAGLAAVGFYKRGWF